MLDEINLWSFYVTWDEIAAHEDLGEFTVVFVFRKPDGVVLCVELLEEPRDGDCFSLVGVNFFEVIKDKGSEKRSDYVRICFHHKYNIYVLSDSAQTK